MGAWPRVPRASRGGIRLSAALLVLLSSASAARAQNPVQAENAKPGTAEWRLTLPAGSREIEGYASETSVDRGGSLDFMVSTAEAQFEIAFYRLGWYGGAGGRLVAPPVVLPGRLQTTPAPDATGMVECRWPASYRLSVPRNADDPTDWASGLYVAKLTALTSGRQSYVPFVVRDDARRSDLLFQSSVTTFQAYNSWGGKSLYSFNSTGAPAVRVSFDRPYADGSGTGQLLSEWHAWEMTLMRFLEREGHDVSYITDIDTHARPGLLARSLHKAWLSVGHDEYWTWEMRDHVEAARDAGLGLGFFGSNIAYWQVRLEPGASGEPYRRMISYKYDYTSDPFYTDGDPSNDRKVTTQFRLAPVNRPEEDLIGVMYAHDPVNVDLVVDDASSWAYAGTGLVTGSTLPGLVGYEVDKMFTSTPGRARLGHSPYTGASGATEWSHMVTFTAPSGATVFATGTLQWTWALDTYGEGPPPGHTSRRSAAAEQVTRNVLARLTAGDFTRTLPTLSVEDAAADEAAGALVFTVRLSGPADEPVTVAYATADGTARAGSDYAAASGTLTFAPGTTVATVGVGVLDDATDEPDETLLLVLSGASGATLGRAQGTGTVRDDDVPPLPALTVSDVTVTEGSSGTVAATFTVRLSAASSGPVTVAYATADGTAVAGSDYTATSGTLTFAPGTTSRTVSVPVIGDVRGEGTETFHLDLGTPSGATVADGRGTATVLDTDPPSFVAGGASVVEGGPGARPALVFTVSLTRAATGTVTVRYGTAAGTARSGSDFTSVSGTLTFAPGETSKTVSVTVLGDAVDEADETVFLNLSRAKGGANIATARGTGTIVDDDPNP